MTCRVSAPYRVPVDDDPFRHWQHLWLRINRLLREMTHAYRDREVRDVLKSEVTKAFEIREAMKRAGWFN